MKRTTILLAIALLLNALFCVAEETSDPFVGKWQDPYYGRAVLEIGKDGDAYAIRIRWGNSADSEAVWKMEAAREENRLVYTGGSMSIVTYSEACVEEDVAYDDAEGAFTLTAEGKLTWEDSREERAPEFALEKLPTLMPDAQALKERFFMPIASQTPGAAGSSLKLAETASELLRFVSEFEIWDADASTLHDNLLEAWTMLDDAMKRRFDEDISSVRSLMEAAMADYDSVAGQFEDAGAEDMAYLARDEEIRRGWETLVSALSEGE